MYQVLHTVDNSGGRCCAAEGWLALETTSFEEAQELAAELVNCGFCGYVRRQDGAVLAPNGTWIARETGLEV